MEASGRTFIDTSDFFDIHPGDEIRVGGKRYEVQGEEREYRFGIEDPKFWVKRVVEGQTGERKIIKLAYEESFSTFLGGVEVHCFRNPAKESDILKLVAGHPAFMQGTTSMDCCGNPVRILDIVRGTNFLTYIDRFKMPHQTYFWKLFPDILRHLIQAFEAIAFLHANGFRHGDIRNDHVFVEHSSGRYVWIDFDYDFQLEENPFGLDIFGLGNLLIYSIGKGFHEHYLIQNEPFIYKDLCERLQPEDFSILHHARLVNLRKFYPYIPPMLNNVLLHFSRGANVFYESVTEIVDDLNGYLASI